MALAVALLFTIANRGAYKGYFSGDDLDNLSWTSNTGPGAFVKGVLSPQFFGNNFRPVGHFYFFALGRTARLHFRPYVVLLELFHLLNGFLLWWSVRKLGLNAWAGLAAVLFFLFHAATFDAYWQPMYIFDVLCGTFCLLSLISFMDGRWIFSLLCFWLAYKAKEVAVMLPMVLLAYEFLVGQRRWKPLVPFFGISLCFGLQAIFANAGAKGAYKLHLTPGSLAETFAFYVPYLFGVSAALIAILLLLIFVRDRRFYFGIIAMALLVIPMLLLPGRLYTVYLYVPLIGAAIALAAVANTRPKYVVPLFALAWLPYTYAQMREYRKATLTAADERRAYVEALLSYAKAAPPTNAYIYDGIPPSLPEYGLSGALYYVTRQPDLKLAWIGDNDAKNLLQENSVAVLSWDQIFRKLLVTRRDPSAPLLPYVKIGPGMPIWQFREGWYPRENYYRWTQAIALASLQCPPHARAFELYVNMSPVALETLHSVNVTVAIDGKTLGEHQFTTAGWQKVSWPVQPGPSKPVEVKIRTEPTYHAENDPRTLGIAIGGFGYIE